MRRVLQVVAVEAYGRAGMYVLRERVMRRANISELAEFLLIAEHLERKGWIAEAISNAAGLNLAITIEEIES